MVLRNFQKGNPNHRLYFTPRHYPAVSLQSDPQLVDMMSGEGAREEIVLPPSEEAASSPAASSAAATSSPATTTSSDATTTSADAAATSSPTTSSSAAAVEHPSAESLRAEEKDLEMTNEEIQQFAKAIQDQKERALAATGIFRNDTADTEDAEKVADAEVSKRKLSATVDEVSATTVNDKEATVPKKKKIQRKQRDLIKLTLN